MAIVVEDGTGKPDSVSYASVAQYKAWCDSRGISYTGTTDIQIENALVKATDAMSQMYRQRWTGYRNTATQALDWPRTLVYLESYIYTGSDNSLYFIDNNIIPKEVVNSCISLAIYSQTESLVTDIDQRVIREKIDVIEVEYDTNALQYKQYRSVDLMLGPYLKSNEGQLRIVR